MSLAIITVTAYASAASASTVGWQTGNITKHQVYAVRGKMAGETRAESINDIIHEFCVDTIRKKVLATPGMGTDGKGRKRSGKIDEMPSFPGGQEAMEKYLNANIRYPKVAFDNNIQGKVTVQFMVEKDGSLNDIEVI